MRIRIRNKVDLTLWSVSATALAVAVTIGIQYVLTPPEVFFVTVLSSTAIAIVLAAPMTWFGCYQIMNAQRNHIKLRRVLDYDTLTGLLTRSRFFKDIVKSINEPGTLVMIDIDHFKMINDRYGHLAGDKVLANTGHILAAGCRRNDLVARFGGEEFVVLLKQLQGLEALEIAERLRRSVELSGVDIDGEIVNVTISIGLAEYDANKPFDAALAKADKALFSAKVNNRNRCVVAEAFP